MWNLSEKPMAVASLALLLLLTRAWSDPQAPGLFIFGDSLLDNGNNNRILSLARANYMPYGIDFPLGVTGRFTNGRTVVDILAQLLGFRDFIPAYANIGRSGVMTGLNFASGAAGIRDETGNNLGQHYSMNVQVDQFRRTVSLIRRMFRGDTTRMNRYISKCIFISGMGSNDYLNNYFMPNLYPSSSVYSPKAYASVLVRQYSAQLTHLYALGARKLAIIGVGQIGCIPYELARYNGNGNGKKNGSRCNERNNNAIAMFNDELLRMVNRLNNELQGAKFTFVNTNAASREIAARGASYGFKVVDKGCCGVGRNNGLITCLPLQMPCNDRRRYIFWDAFHPTDAANIIYATRAYNSTSSSDVYPMNIRQLAMA